MSEIVPVDVTASDNVGVTRVDLLVTGALFATDNTAPYAFSWDSTSFAGSSVTLTARVYDAVGNSANSAPVTATVPRTNVNDTTAPTASINRPANGSVVNGMVTIGASATDNVGVVSLSVYLDGAM